LRAHVHKAGEAAGPWHRQIKKDEINFTATLEAGAQWLNRQGNGALLVYRFHHLSNAGTGYDNSALASHVISVGVRWKTRGR